MTPEIWFTTAIGYLVPIAMLLYIRRENDPYKYLMLAAFTTFMGTAGMGKLLPFFGHSVVGGSLYFPTALLSMSMAGYYLSNEVTLRRMASSLLLGCTFVIIGASRWLIFAVYGEHYTTHDYTENYHLVLTSSVMLFKVYFATMVGVAMSRWRPKCEALLIVPALIEILITLPLPVYAAWKLNPDIPADQWGDIALWTLFVRMSLVLAVGLAIYLFPHNGGSNEGSDSRSVSPP